MYAFGKPSLSLFSCQYVTGMILAKVSLADAHIIRFNQFVKFQNIGKYFTSIKFPIFMTKANASSLASILKYKTFF